MKNEILWKWELLCNEFDEAKRNYISVFSPVIESVANAADEPSATLNLAQLKAAEAAWNNWVDIQDQLKKFVEENT